MLERKNEYKSYPLFNDVEDAELRLRNRAVMIVNIMEDHLIGDKGNISLKGTQTVLGYVNQIPFEERAGIDVEAANIYKERGSHAR